MDAIVVPGDTARGGRLGGSPEYASSEAVVAVGRLIQESCTRYCWKAD
jgi:hypothetical protein